MAGGGRDVAQTEQRTGPSKRRSLESLAHLERPVDDPQRLAYVRALTETLGEGVMAADPSGAITFVNRAGEELLGWHEAELLGRRAHNVMHHTHADGTPFPYEACPMRAVANGETVRVERDVFVRRDGTFVPVAYVAAPLLLDGVAAGTVLSFHDTTALEAAERERDLAEAERARLLASERDARKRLAFLAEASVALASAALDYETTLARIAALAVPRIADWCAVDIVEPDGSLRRVVTAHVDPEKVALAKEIEERYPSDPEAGGVAHVVRTGRTEIYPEITDEMIAANVRDGAHRELIQALGMRAALVVPLAARNRVFGAITLVWAESGMTFEPDDVALAEDLARRAAMAIDNARLFADRANVARTLQQSLLPPQLPAIPGTAIGAHYHAAGEGNDVGGDFYDVFRTGRRRWVAVMGDVCGKGVDAAAVTGLARHTIRGAAMQERSPSKILRTLNEALLRQRKDERFVTAVVATLERTPAGLRVAVASGGHPAPAVIRADGRVQPVDAQGTLLGLFPEPSLHDVELSVEAGDTLVFYTDGVTEARKDLSFLGQDGLIGLLTTCRGLSANEIAERVARTVVAYQHGVLRDDVALLVIQATR